MTVHTRTRMATVYMVILPRHVHTACSHPLLTRPVHHSPTCARSHRRFEVMEGKIYSMWNTGTRSRAAHARCVQACFARACARTLKMPRKCACARFLPPSLRVRLFAPLPPLPARFGRLFTSYPRTHPTPILPLSPSLNLQISTALRPTSTCTVRTPCTSSSRTARSTACSSATLPARTGFTTARSSRSMPWVASSTSSSLSAPPSPRPRSSTSRHVLGLY